MTKSKGLTPRELRRLGPGRFKLPRRRQSKKLVRCFCSCGHDLGKYAPPVKKLPMRPDADRIRIVCPGCKMPVIITDSALCNPELFNTPGEPILTIRAPE